MHYYQFNIGDYKSHTAHLDPIEDIAYRRMLDWYYLHEKPLPKKTEEIARLINMRTHCDSIAAVLKEFFTFDKSAQAWRNKRADEGIESYNAKSEKARNSAKARWDKEKDDANAMRPHSERNANHKPITNNQLRIKDANNTGVKTPAESTPCPHQKIVDLYHEKLPMCPRVVTLSDARKRSLRARWTNGASNLEFWGDYFGHVAESKFLTGKVDPPPGRKQFIADFDFLIRESTIIKTQEGKYHG